MRVPRLRGEIGRRLLMNYRADPDTVARLLPPPFRPQLVEDSAVAGICLIRLGAMRPAGVPRWAGLRSENAAHRVAVEWDDAEGTHTRVYIPRRDSDSWVNIALGGRIYPGEHHRARCAVRQPGGSLGVLRARLGRLLRHASAIAVRRPPTTDLAMEGRARRRHPRPLIVLRRPHRLPARNGEVRQCTGHAQSPRRMASPRTTAQRRGNPRLGPHTATPHPLNIRYCRDPLSRVATCQARHTARVPCRSRPFGTSRATVGTYGSADERAVVRAPFRGWPASGPL